MKLTATWPVGLAVAVLSAGVLAGCGDSSHPSSSRAHPPAAASTTEAAVNSGGAFLPSGHGGLTLLTSAPAAGPGVSSPLGIAAEGGVKERTAVAAANAEAVKLGSFTIPKGSTVGLEEIIGSIPSAQRLDSQLIYALRELGITVIPCDGEGDPTKMETCISSLVSQKVKAIISLATDPSLIAQGLQQAKAAHIPVISFGGAVAASPLFYRRYYMSDTTAGKIIGKWIVAQLKAHGGGSIWISNYPATWAAERTAGVLSAAKQAHLPIAGQATVDSTNPIAGTQQQVIAQYTRDPGTRAYWFSYDTPGAAAAQALFAKDGGKPWPKGPLVVTLHDDQQANGLLRQGALTAVVDQDYDASSFEAADAVARYLAGKPVPASDTGEGYEGHQMWSYPVITRANNPATGKWPEPDFDVVSYFTELWHKEFGLS